MTWELFVLWAINLAAIPIGIGLIHWLLPTPKKAASGKSRAELERLYGADVKIYDQTTLILILPVFFAIEKPLEWLYAWLPHRASSDTIAIFGLSSFLPLQCAAGFLMVGTLFFLPLVRQRIKLKKDYADFEQYLSMYWELNAAPIIRYVFPVFVVLGLAMTVLSFRFYDEFKVDRILLGQPALGVPKEYRYSDITRVLYVPPVPKVKRTDSTYERYVIEFKDGTRWDSAFADDRPLSDYSAVLAHVQKVTGLRIEEWK